MGWGKKKTTTIETALFGKTASDRRGSSTKQLPSTVGIPFVFFAKKRPVTIPRAKDYSSG